LQQRIEVTKQNYWDVVSLRASKRSENIANADTVNQRVRGALDPGPSAMGSLERNPSSLTPPRRGPKFNYQRSGREIRIVGGDEG
jgi:hypothetical protein